MPESTTGLGGDAEVDHGIEEDVPMAITPDRGIAQAQAEPQRAVTTPPLAGMRVLDFTHVLAGPFCTRLLADLGAEVVRVESSRHPVAPWRSAMDPGLDRDVSYLVVNRNKQSVAINLKTEQGRELATRLAAAADVLTENFSAGVMARLGLDYERLSSLNPRLVYVSMSGYGHHGPRQGWTSMNTNLQAYSGLMLVTGKPDTPPTAISNSWMDYVGGLHAAFAIVEALASRASSGVGRQIDLSQFECGVSTLGPLLVAGAADRAAPERTGNRSAHAAPQGCYPCAGDDQWCTISVQTGEQWHALAEALGSPAWSRDARFDTLGGRVRHHDEIDAHLAEWTRRMSAAEAEQHLRSAGVPARRMRRINDVLESPDASGVFQTVDGLASVPVMMTGLPFTMAPVALPSPARAPRRSEHTEHALSAWLGLEAEEITRLREQDVLV